MKGIMDSRLLQFFSIIFHPCSYSFILHNLSRWKSQSTISRESNSISRLFAEELSSRCRELLRELARERPQKKSDPIYDASHCALSEYTYAELSLWKIIKYHEICLQCEKILVYRYFSIDVKICLRNSFLIAVTKDTWHKGVWFAETIFATISS